jgi:hypothetical protein
MYEGCMKTSSFSNGSEGRKIALFESEGIFVRVDEHLRKMGAVC